MDIFLELYVQYFVGAVPIVQRTSVRGKVSASMEIDTCRRAEASQALSGIASHVSIRVARGLSHPD